MSKNKLQRIAEETIEAIDNEKYTAPSGKKIPLGKLIESSVKRSKLYRPDDIVMLESSNSLTRKLFPTPQIIVTRESSLEAAARLVNDRPCLLNFASAKRPGGAFLQGAAAQEESIARSSGLYPTLIRYQEFYEENKISDRKNTGLYLDYAIYSPDVPVFKNDDGNWLEEPYLTSIITSPAPNRYAIFSEDNESELLDNEFEVMEKRIEDTIDKRMRQVLSIMAKQGHQTIILGAWGCGAFGNDSLMVAELFKDNLKKLPFFDKIVFPIFDRYDSETFRSFVQIFGQQPSQK
jgi:uncharacterized protein (TIGR02452 family)